MKARVLYLQGFASIVTLCVLTSTACADFEVASYTQIISARIAHDPGLFGTRRDEAAREMDLEARYWMPAHPVAHRPSGLFIFGTHGLRESLLQRDALARELVQEGFVVAGFDLPGHGSSPNMGSVQGERDARLPALRELSRLVVRFTQATQDHFRPTFGELPTIIYGHSTGGAIALDAVTGHPAGDPEDLALWQDLKIAGSVISHPSLGPFPYQVPLGPVIRAASWVAPGAPLFPLTNFSFVRRSYPGRADLLEGGVASLPDAFVDASGSPRMNEQERTARRSFRGQLQPVWTALQLIEAGHSRTALASQGQFLLSAPIVFIHPASDTASNSKLTQTIFAQNLRTGEHEMLFDGSGTHRHGEMDDPSYVRAVVEYAASMRDGKPPSAALCNRVLSPKIQVR